jgi:hypothetical protein
MNTRFNMNSVHLAIPCYRIGICSPTLRVRVSRIRRADGGLAHGMAKNYQGCYLPKCDTLQNPATECKNEKCKADICKLKSSTAGLRFHDLRHHAITELADSLASDQTIMSIAGHVSARMLAHYSHVRLDAKRHALDAISSKRSKQDAVKSETRVNRAVTAQTTAQIPRKGLCRTCNCLKRMAGTTRLELATSAVTA